MYEARSLHSGWEVAYVVLVRKTEGRMPLGRPRRRWEDTIKMDFQAVGWGAWTGLMWLRIGAVGGDF
jgi:hypothetical protein